MKLYVGRAQETADLARLREKRTSSLVVCKGRRRIGKSTFIRECADGFDQFLAFEGLPPRRGIGPSDQLRELTRQLARQTALPELTVSSWPEAFELLSSAVDDSGWTLLLLDEISWMSVGEPDFAGHLKTAWDRLFSRRDRLVVVLCGSVSSWIDENVLSSPGFVGRCSLEIALGPLELRYCDAFWGRRQVDASEKLKILSVTGGVPRYLEEIDPRASAEQNIHRLCFSPGGFLFREFEQIFHDVFGRRAGSHREAARALVDGSATVGDISKALEQGRGGTLSAILAELAASGFVSRDVGFDPNTANPRARGIRYRLSDNYLRFYLKYVAPRRSQIEKGLYRHAPLESFVAWDTILGLQLENLVIASFESLRETIGLAGVNVLNMGPYHQGRTRTRRACQIDLLIRTKNAVYVVEAKAGRAIGPSVAEEVQAKVEALSIKKGISIRTVLVHVDEVSRQIEQEDYFDHVVPLEQLLADSQDRT